jgi:hypothetical protein
MHSRRVTRGRCSSATSTCGWLHRITYYGCVLLVAKSVTDSYVRPPPLHAFSRLGKQALRTQAGPASLPRPNPSGPPPAWSTRPARLSSIRVPGLPRNGMADVAFRFPCTPADLRGFPNLVGRRSCFRRSNLSKTPVLLRRCCRAGGGVVHGIFSCQTARIRPNPNSKQPQPRNSMAIKHGQRSKLRWLPLLLSSSHPSPPLSSSTR